MSNYNNGTPCPAPLSSGRAFASSKFGESKQKQNNIFDGAFDEFNDDNTTQNIARLVQQEFKNAPPRRTFGLAQKPRRNAPVGVFDDGSGRRGDALRTSAINARPAQKIRPQKSRNAASTINNDILKSDGAGSHDEIDLQTAGKKTNHRDNDRRRTIWIPEDTTVLSIHPGAYDKTLNDETIGFPAKGKHASASRNLAEKATNINMPHSSRRPVPTAPAKRNALRTLAPAQPNAAPRNISGSGGGKENIAPGAMLSRYGKNEKLVIKPLENRQSTTAVQARLETTKKRSASEIKEGAPRAKMPAIKDPRPRDHDCAPTSRTKVRHAIPNLDVRNDFYTNASRYPVLSDDLCRPELYEDNWLQHQEVALTQLVNVVFEQADHPSIILGDRAVNLRGRLLDLYSDSSFALLHKRLKASLVYGVLSLPKDSPNPPKLREDVGMRRQFIDLFVNSYDPSVLQAAAEVSVGRVMADHDASKTKELRHFLLTFLVRHEDSTELVSVRKVKIAEEASLQPGTAEWFWQRTVLRSLMMIHLLDSAKSTGAFEGCLFQTSSVHKSSGSVLHALAKIMFSVGDVTRPLGHLDYTVSHVQQPLEEYTYRINNLAVDLRSGVLLTRFVELLLYPSSCSSSESGSITTATLTGNTHNQILTRHLKFPCAGRAQKLHNVQVALSALAGVRGLAETAIENIRPEDIVDGHREKTLSLLWSLVSRWGLALLVDWRELEKETRRFSCDFTPVSSSGIRPDENEQGSLLKAWAASICQHHNIPVRNLTTSFADGRVLATITSIYAEFLPAISSRVQASVKSSTADILRRIGCSKSFIDLFASHGSTIPSRSGTISLLAFLASRLLPLARTYRAASTVQRAYRLRLARKSLTVHVQRSRAAAECALVAQTKQKELEAAITLQRAWRGVLDRRINNMEQDVLAIQTLARGWAVRNALGGALGSGVGGRRVMGGW